MILATSILFFALFSPVELFKFHKAPEGQGAELQGQRQYQSGLYLGAPRYYPLSDDLFQAPLQQQQQQQLFQQPPFEQQQQLPLNEPSLHQATKGGELKATKGLEQRPQLTQESYLQAPYVQPQPASIAYLVVRPIQAGPLMPAPIARPPLSAVQPVRPPFKQEELAGTKGSRQNELQAEQATQQIEQQHEIADEQPLQPALVVPVPPGKEGKFKALLDRMMSKLTLGSSYHVSHEEIVQPPPQRQPALQAQQPISIQQQPIELQQQKVEQLEDQRLEQQLEQQRDNFFDEGLKQTKGNQEQQLQLQQQQQIRDEQLRQQNLAEHDLQKQRDQQAFKGQQQPLQQEPIRQELEPVRQEASKGKRLLPDRLAGQQQIQPALVQQESLRQEAKGNAGF